MIGLAPYASFLSFYEVARVDRTRCCRDTHYSREDEMKIFIMMFASSYDSGQSPAEADQNLLETARRCELYGMKMHAAKVRYAHLYVP